MTNLHLPELLHHSPCAQPDVEAGALKSDSDSDRQSPLKGSDGHEGSGKGQPADGDAEPAAGAEKGAVVPSHPPLTRATFAPTYTTKVSLRSLGLVVCCRSLIGSEFWLGCQWRVSPPLPGLLPSAFWASSRL